MNQKEQIRKELNEYLDTKIPITEIDIYKHVVDFIKKDRKKQLILNGVVKSFYCYDETVQIARRKTTCDEIIKCDKQCKLCKL
tara:strand:+ start:306 stop:554 length:249 start_codon:yes stop_codon:yes gene_type:complete